jgi:DNA-binding CsgD family transcriptional regulator
MIVGRDGELASIDRFLDAVAQGPAGLLIAGEAGVGKTTLWRETLDRGAGYGHRVLSCRPVEPETQLSYAALDDLLRPVVDEVLQDLPGPQRQAVEAVLLRIGSAGAAADPRALSAGVVGVLRRAAAAGPLLVGVDDVQWIDRPSRRVLEFAMRRVQGESLGVVVALRTPNAQAAAVPLGLDRALGTERVSRLPVAGVAVGALHRIVGERFGQWLPRPVLGRLHEASGGNPFFALELAGAWLRRGKPTQPGLDLALPDTLRELVRDRLAPLSRDAREALLVAAAAAPATVEIVVGASDRPATTLRGLAEAEDAGMIVRDGETLRFTHPLLASAVYAEAPPARRRRLHRAIAAVVGEAEPRARHLALGAEAPDAEVAAALDQAAISARARGAPDAAAELTELAGRLTPRGDRDGRVRRATDLGQVLFQAGETSRARRELEALVAASPPGRARARALLVLAPILYEEENAAAAATACRQALAEAGANRPTLAEAHATLAQVLDLDNAQREAHARAALRLLDQEPAPDPRLLAAALLALTMAWYYTGRGIPMEVAGRAIALEERLAERPRVAWRARTILGQYRKYHDDFQQARRVLEVAHRQALEEGDESSLADLLAHLAELELWEGNWPAAAGLAERCMQAAEQTAQHAQLAIACYARGLVAAHLGAVEAARGDAEAGLALGERRGNPWAVGINLWVLGFLDLSVGDLAAVDRVLSRADQVGEAIGLREPGQWRFHADHIEALVGLGQLDRAEALLVRLEGRGRAAGRVWALATAGRCRALLAGARGDLEGALKAVDQALVDHDRLAMPFELARTLLVRGQARRRLKHKRTAKESLEGALRIFEELGAPLWAERARGELQRLGLRPPARGELTPTERRVAELVAAGCTNREVATALFVSVHTVEDNLKRVYRKLGVRSRTELALRLAGRPAVLP